MEAYLIVGRTVDKTPYKLLTVRLNKKFNSKMKVHDLQQKAFKLGITKPVIKKVITYFKPSQEQINFVHAMVLNGYNTEKIQDAYFEQFELRPSSSQIANTLSKKNTLQNTTVIVNESSHKPWHSDSATRKQCRCIVSLTSDLTGSAKSKAVKDMYESKKYTKLEAMKIIQDNEDKLNAWKKEHGYGPKTDGKFTHEENFKISRWTPEEDNVLYTFKMDSNKPLNAMASSWPELEGRTERAVRERWYRIRNKMNVVPTPKKSIEENLAKLEEYLKPNVAKTMWTIEQDFDILCYFYEYSIDEARNRFNAPYSVIASRLETLVDSTEPEHIELLMKATKAIKARRKQEAEDAKNGFWKRRKLRKMAKREAKKERRIEYRLQRLEDMFSKRQAKLDKKVAKAEERLKKLRGE